MSDFGSRISAIESGGRYDILGPQTRTGDRAYGKYQVMGANVGPWTASVFGRPMTPDEFLANPQAQDAVFENKFGELVAKHGPNGAARAWFAGEGGMNDMGRKDVLGTSVADYERKFAGSSGTVNPAAPYSPVQSQAGPVDPYDIATAFSSNTDIPTLTRKPVVPQMDPRGAQGADSAAVNDPIFEPRWARKRRQT